MRQMHPFPIFERFLTRDLTVEEGYVSPSASTSATPFSPLLKSSGCPFSGGSSKKAIYNDSDSNSSEIDDDCISNPHHAEHHPTLLKHAVPHSSSSFTTVHTPVPATSSGSRVRVLIKANTQVVMFPSDWRDHKSWPVFGAGKRACPGKLDELNAF